GIPDPDWPGGPLDARKAKLGEVLEDVGTKTLRYIYDFGNGWEYTIKIERLIDPVSGMVYPRLIEAVGRCPPEDIGGPWGYAEFLEAISDPHHERHAEFRQWVAKDFDPHLVNGDGLAEEVAGLAKRWTQKRRPSARVPNDPRCSPYAYEADEANEDAPDKGAGIASSIL
ncbi:MAG: plasmid pRiA4b ORF-3 family protein, partial [Candidatus Acidiferrales bacterium]